MLQRDNIHHRAILRPRFTKDNPQFCDYYYRNKRHAFTKNEAGQQQCVECGKIKWEPRYGLY